MQKISTEADGVFKDGVPGVSRGTKCNAAWHNAVQNEICNLLTLNGVSLDPNDNTQLYNLFRETLDRIFKGSVSVQDPLNPGTETTIDPDAISIHGVVLQRSEISAVVWLLVSECVNIAKNLAVAGHLSVNGDVNVVGTANLAAVVCNALRAAGDIVCNGNFAANNAASFNTMTANSATFKSVLSAVDHTQDYGGSDVEIDNNDFSNSRKRIRAVVMTGDDRQHPSRVLNITATPVDGLRIHVVNMATAADGFVFVKWNTNNLCVLSPGADRWFSVAAGSWLMDRVTVG
jgi:hypothetical protein